MHKSGVICRIESDRYFILSPQGQFIMRRGKPAAGVCLGSVVPLAPSRRQWKRMWAVAAALALLAVTSVVVLPRVSALDYRLALDINPSIELVYTREYMLKEWKAFDPAGSELLDGLEKPDNVYVAIEAVFSRCLELGLAKDGQDIFITAEFRAPIDDERLTGAFEGHGVAVRLHIVRLEKKEYRTEGKSPLRGYLQRKGAGGPTEPLAPIVLDALQDGVSESIDIAPWHNNSAVQNLLEKYLVTGKLVEKMLAEGLAYEEIDRLLATAEAEKMAPSEIFKALRQSGKSTEQFLKGRKGTQTPQTPASTEPQWLPDFLATEFNRPAGQLSSYLRKGIPFDDLLALLVLEELGGGTLEKLKKDFETTDLKTLVGRTDIDSASFTGRLEQLQELTRQGENKAGLETVGKLAADMKVSKGEVLYILAKGYSLEAAREILAEKSPRQGLKELIDIRGGESHSDKGKGKGKGK